MKYKVVIEVASYFEREILAKDEDEAEELAEKEFKKYFLSHICHGFELTQQETNVIDLQEIKE